MSIDAANNSGKEIPVTVVEQARQALDIPKYRVLLHNDDKNDMVHVVKSLMLVFKFQPNKAQQIMREAHDNGVALCTIEPLEVAELRKNLLNACSLISTIEPE